MEDVVPSRKRGSEEVGPPDDPSLMPADGVADGRERDGSDPRVTGCGAGELHSGRTDLAISGQHGLRARRRRELCDRLEHE